MRFTGKVVLIGASAGGPPHIEKIVKALPWNYSHTVVAAVHMPPYMTKRMAERLHRESAITVVEAQNNLVLRPGTAVLARGGAHLQLTNGSGGLRCRVVPHDGAWPFVPSVDDFFTSAIGVLPPDRIVAVLLTGCGTDGATGLLALKRYGALTIAEDETAPVDGMPKAARMRNTARFTAGIDRIVELLVSLQ